LYRWYRNFDRLWLLREKVSNQSRLLSSLCYLPTPYYDMAKRLTKQDRAFLKLLGELLEYGRAHMRHRIPNSGESYEKTALYLLYRFTEEQLEAIEVLCKKAMASQAVSQLRNVFEAELYAFYLSGRGSERRVALYAIGGVELQIRSLRGFKAFVQKYPTWKDRDELTNLKTLETGINEKLKNIKTVRRNYSLRRKDSLPSVERISQLCDITGPKKYRKGNTEYLYQLLYRYSSTHIHPTPLALDRFLIKKPSENDLNEAVLATATVLFLDLLKLLKRQGVLDSKVKLGRFTKRHNQLRKKG